MIIICALPSAMQNECEEKTSNQLLSPYASTLQKTDNLCLLMVRVRLKQTNKVKQYNKWLIELSIHDGKFYFFFSSLYQALAERFR